MRKPRFFGWSAPVRGAVIKNEKRSLLGVLIALLTVCLSFPALAQTEGVEEMTDEHWKLVNYLREYYLEFGIAPMIRKLCKETGFKLKKVYELFPSGPAKGACKVAGLPKPTGCV